MEEESSKLEMHISWTKTKVQNLGAGPDAQNLVVNGHTVDGVSEFIYLGSKQSSHANSSTECIPLLPVSWITLMMYGDNSVLVYTQN